MFARRRFIVDAELAEADPGRQSLEEPVALRKVAQRRRGTRRQQTEVAGIFRDLLPRAPVDQRIEAAHGLAAQEGLVVAMGFGGIDDVIAFDDPVPHQLFDQ